MRMLESCITKLEEKKMKFPYFLKKKNAWMLCSNEVLKAPEVSSWEDASKLFSFPSLCIKNLFILWKLSIFIFYSLFYSCMCFVNIFLWYLSQNHVIYEKYVSNKCLKKSFLRFLLYTFSWTKILLSLLSYKFFKCGILYKTTSLTCLNS